MVHVPEGIRVGQGVEKLFQFIEGSEPYSGNNNSAHEPSVNPNAKASDALKNPLKEAWSNPNYDCSEIANDIYNYAGGKGMIIEMKSSKSNGIVNIPMAGGKIEDFVYHQVYSDGRFVFDPRLSSEPISLADYIKQIQSLNSDVTFTTITP